MRNLLASFCWLLFLPGLHAQDRISFEEDASLQQLFAEAAKARKLLFVDCYTSWCAPCKWMDRNVFNTKEVAGFYNTSFINAKIDMEKGEGIAFRKKYEVSSFPTYLFLDSSGKIIHRSGSRMSMEEFLQEGKTAVNPGKSLSALSELYQKGDRDPVFLLDYISALQKTNRAKGDSVTRELETAIPDKLLLSSDGWPFIYKLARSDKDRFGKTFTDNKMFYKKLVPGKEFLKVEDQLWNYSLMQFTRDNNKDAFFALLPVFKNSPDSGRMKKAVLAEADWYLQTGNVDSFRIITEKAGKTILKHDAEALSFIARRASYAGQKNGANLFAPQAYELAKQAVAIEPDTYGIQSTLAQICLLVHKKEEGIQAASAARKLADAETSKIQKLAQDLLDKLNAL